MNKPLTEEEKIKIEQEMVYRAYRFRTCADEKDELDNIIKGLEEEIQANPSTKLKELLYEAKLEQIKVARMAYTRRREYANAGLGRNKGI